MTNSRNNYFTKGCLRKLLFAGLLRKAREPGPNPLQANTAGTGPRIFFPGTESECRVCGDVRKVDEYCGGSFRRTYSQLAPHSGIAVKARQFT